MDAPGFIAVEIDPGPAAEDGLSLRFKRAGEPRTVRALPYESETGLSGAWQVLATDDPEGAVTRPATAVPVEDSSEGTVWLVVGGTHGLVLVHTATAMRERVPYLVLSLRARLD